VGFCKELLVPEQERSPCRLAKFGERPGAGHGCADPERSRRREARRASPVAGGGGKSFEKAGAGPCDEGEVKRTFEQLTPGELPTARPVAHVLHPLVPRRRG